jgi:hypothetical protein
MRLCLSLLVAIQSVILSSLLLNTSKVCHYLYVCILKCKAYVTTLEFHPKFLGLTGTYQQIKRIAKTYRLYFSAPPLALDDDAADYLVDHSIFFYLVGPDGKYIAHFGRQDSTEEVTAQILTRMKHPQLNSESSA